MQIALVHLSDLHIRAPGENNVFASLEAADRVVDAVRARLTGCSLGACFILVTGDIAYHGLRVEYDFAMQILATIRGGIAKDLGHGVPCHLLTVPGNHDCDFTETYNESAARTRLLTTEGLEKISPLEFEIVTCVQANYRHFERMIFSENPNRGAIIAQSSNPCLSIQDYQIGIPPELPASPQEEIVRFYLFNTAWMSQQREKQGLLVLPTAGFGSTEDVGTASVAVVLQHHPRNWLRTSNSREVARFQEAIADLILTGHEHESDDANVTRASGAQVHHIEGFALQSDANPNVLSAFKVIVLDTAEKTQVTNNLVLRPTGLYEPVSESPPPQPLNRNPRRLENTYSWSERGSEFVVDLGLPVTHDRRDRVSLEDLFVYPYLREVTRHRPSEERQGRLSAENLEWVGRSLLVVGCELSGKTTFARKLFSDARQHHDLVPVYVRGIEFKKGTPRECQDIVESAFRAHYQNPVERFRQLPKERRVLLLDDVHRCGKRGAGLQDVLRLLKQSFGTVVAFADTMLMLDEISRDKESPFEDFQHYEILPVGHVKRDELVRRWCTLGQPSSDHSEVKRRAARVLQQVDAIMGKRFVPHVPYFIIGILQQIGTVASPESLTASQGAVFEALATLKLQGKFKDDVLTAKNYLAHLAFELYERRQRFISLSDFRDWHRGYCDNLKLVLTEEDMLRRLVDAQILQILDSELSFRHRYGYYLFVAEYLARHLEEDRVRELIDNMFRSVFHEETANVLVFLCFKAAGHTDFVVRSMLEASASIFSKQLPATLDSDASALGRLLPQGHPVTVATLDPDLRRRNMLQETEAADGPDTYGSIDEDDLDAEITKERDYPPEVKEIYAAIHTIQILGQILRNFYGTLNGGQKVEIARSAYDLAMRVTGWYFSFVSEHQEELATELARILSRDRPSIAGDQRRLRDEVRATMVGLTELVATSMVKRASEATAMTALLPVLSEVLRQPSPSRSGGNAAHQLIWLDVCLALQADPPIGEVRAAAKALKDNAYARRILQHLGWLYLHINYVEAQKTQQICTALDIRAPLPDTAVKPIRQLPTGR